MQTQGWSFERRSLLLLRCDALCRVPGLAHAFSTRVAGEDRDFDLGSAEAPSEPLVLRRAAFLECAGLAAREPLILRQVHGDSIIRVGGEGHEPLHASAGADPPRADAGLWVEGDRTDLAPSVRTADCVPILLAERSGRAAAAVHAGWRGTAAGIAVRALEALRDALAPGPVEVIAALGPAILSCCYEVGADVERAVLGAAASPRPREAQKRTLDLHRANRWQLQEAGVPAGAIHAAPWCTRCRSDLFFSYRRDGAAAGRMMAAIGPCP